MVLPSTVKSNTGLIVQMDEALSITKSVLKICSEAFETSYFQDQETMKAFRIVARKLYGMRIINKK